MAKEYVLGIVEEITALYSNAPSNTKITEESRFTDDLGFDSLDIIEMTMAVEFEFDIILEDEELERINTVGELVKLVEGKVNNKRK